MPVQSQETIASRFIRLNQLLLGKSNYNLPRKYLVHRDGLLDILFALYEECNVDYMRRDKHIASFVDKFRGLMIELKSLRVNLKDFEVKKIIGRGHFGEVQVVREKITGDVYAMKVLRKQETLSQQNVAFYEEERDIMAKATSPWITKLQYAFQDSHNLYLIMEFHPGGDMLSLLEKYDNVLPDDMCQFYLAELVLAIHSVHMMGYVHRDIKPDNILIDRTGHIKLADFGSASKLNPHKQVTSNMPVGTPDYVAPEVLAAMNPGPASSKSYGIECDWWSLGIVTYEMVFGSTPFSDEKVLITYNNIMNFKNFLKFPSEASEVSDTLIELIKGLLEEASVRLGYDQLIIHPLFTDIDWNNIRHTAPPFVPTVLGVDDTSNFDDFEPENRPYVGDLKCKREFSGKNLPFVGFTYTTPFEAKVDRLSSSDVSLLSPSSLSDSADVKRKINSLNSKISELIESEVKLKADLKKLQENLETKQEELDTKKHEKTLLEQLVDELSAEVKQVKQLLAFEREHRVITEQKAAQIVRCMKTRQRQDALRLKAKSLEYNKGENDRDTLEEQLDEALSRLDEFVAEKADLLEDLQDTKHLLLECQKKLTERERKFSILYSEERDGNVDSDKLVGSQGESKPAMENQDFKNLIVKLEKKNIELEHELELTVFAKKEAEAQTVALRNAIVQLENKMKQMEKENTEIPSQNQEDLSIQEIVNHKDGRQNIEERIKIFEEGSGKLSSLKKSQRHSSPLCDLNKFQENVQVSEKKMRFLPEKQEQSFIEASDLKQENEYLKSKIEVLSSEISKLKENAKNEGNLHSDIEKLLKEKEKELSEAKLDLRISVRKEQQAESLVNSLRERNKELRDKIKSIEDIVAEKTKAENEKEQQMKLLESELSAAKQEINEKSKMFEIEKAKLEERVKTIHDACENSKDVSQKFAKSQGQYEEIVKQNMNLIKESEEKGKTISNLLEEIKNLRNELIQKKNECTKYEKSNRFLKSNCLEMEEELKDFEIIMESRDKTISELGKERIQLKSDIKKLEEKLKLLNTCNESEEKQRAKFVKHIEELTSEMENQNLLHEAELQTLQEQLSHYKKVTQQLEEQSTELQKELSLQDKDIKGYSGKVLTLESELCEIKEEAARHITQISSLKASNLKLTQALEDALENQQDAKQKIEELYNELESEKANHHHEKVKLKETISQQVKLIDFLQSKTENMEKKKRPNISRLFGKKDSASISVPGQFRDAEKLLETERSRCRRLQDQLSQARAENMALQREINNLNKASTTNVEVPVSPISRAMHSAITQSPSGQSGLDSPGLISSEMTNKFTKPPGMKHRIPHRFCEVMCMRSTKCCACLDSLHFGRRVVKCQECSIMCHRSCASSLPNTCGLPTGFLQHFKTAINEHPPISTPDTTENKLTEGWVKLPKSNKLGWDRRFLRITDNVLYVFENGEEKNPSKALMVFDFHSDVSRIVVTSAVSATELTFAATSDLPYVLKLEYFPSTTCWPQRYLYIMALNFYEKQMWVSTLENLAEENQTEVDGPQKQKLVGKSLWTLKGDKLVDPLCTFMLDEEVVLLGAMDGLYRLKIVNKFTCSLKCKIEGIDCVYQMSCMKNIGLLIFIQGESRRLTYTEMHNMQSLAQKSLNPRLITKPVMNIDDCHLFATEDSNYRESPNMCIATSNEVTLCQWNPVGKAFYPKKRIETNEPCSCLLFTESSVIFGTDIFYELDLETYVVKKFLDSSDASLAGLVYGASQFRSFPVAIFSVASVGEDDEYLLCFHEMGVFVNSNGQRTRPDDMKWSRLPLSFAYRSPYLFVTHFNSIEIVEMPPQTTSKSGLQAVLSVQNPQYLGPAHVEQAVYLSSTHDQTVELILVEGKSIGNSNFPSRDTCSISASDSPNSCDKNSIPESEGLDFSFTTSIDQSLEDLSADQTSLSSKTSEEYASSQS